MARVPILPGDEVTVNYNYNYINLVMISTSLVVDRLNHPTSEESLPSLGEGDLVELAPAVRQVSLKFLIWPKEI